MRKKASTVLSDRERLFCYNYVNNGNIKESALKSGYQKEPERVGIRLLAKKEISNEILRLYKLKNLHLQNKAKSGYERLAFGNISDPVSLLFCDTPTLQMLENMDLFNISEIKRNKDGGIEIKFFDRLTAIAKLHDSGHNNADDVTPFYKALENGAKAINLKEKESEE